MQGWVQFGRVLAGLVGGCFVVGTVGSAIRTVVLPRAVPARLARLVFRGVRALFGLRLGRAPDYLRKDRVMAPYGPVALLVLLQAWLAVVWLGYGLIQVAVSGERLWPGLRLSGSSLLTLGFETPSGVLPALIAFSEAAVGLTLLALLITYLPSLYGAFSRREAAVSKLEVRAGAPPTGAEMLRRAWVLERFHLLGAVWSSWEDWFIDVEETHTSFPALPFFRSPQPDRSWVTASGAVLDAASLYASVVAGPRDLDAELCLRAGYLALRRIAQFFRLGFPADPAPTDPVSISREEFDEVVRGLAGVGVPVREDRDQAWRDFAGWRVNYDEPLVRLAALTTAPYAPWSSDRSMMGRGGPGRGAAVSPPGPEVPAVRSVRGADGVNGSPPG